MNRHFDLAVIGAGSGGLGAALAAARLGLRVALVEQASQLGGTAVRGGVSSWEPGAGGTGLPFDLYRRLQQLPQAVAILSLGRHMMWQTGPREARFPGGEFVVDPTRRYRDTLRRAGVGPPASSEAACRELLHQVIFEPAAYATVVESLLAETGGVTVRRGAGLGRVEVAGGQVRAAELTDGSRLAAAVWVDGTADGVLAAAAGCCLTSGQESRATYDEPGAPAEANDRLNGVTLVYRLTRADRPGVEPLPTGVDAACWWRPQFPCAVYFQFPGGDWYVNMLPTLEGAELPRLGAAAARREAERRVRAHWHDVQTHWPEFRAYRLAALAPALGVREGPRLVGRRVLTEHDVRAGLSGQPADDRIALADHALDRHGQGSQGCGELAEPYGIPYACLLPREVDNLLVACRAFSASSLAASSCRLSRTMMQLGQAAGTAAALALERGVALPALDTQALRNRLAAQGVQLTSPATSAILMRLTSEDHQKG